MDKSNITRKMQPKFFNRDEVITIPEMARALRIGLQQAYDLANTPGFPLLNFGGERRRRVIWGDVLDWLRENKGAAS